jgi:hypothetical protein
MELANNFKIVRKENKNHLELKLVGDFDGSAAHTLIKELKKGCVKCNKISVDTSCLRRVLPFGQGVCTCPFSLPPEQIKKIVFTGDKAVDIFPRGR